MVISRGKEYQAAGGGRRGEVSTEPSARGQEEEHRKDLGPADPVTLSSGLMAAKV